MISYEYALVPVDTFQAFPFSFSFPETPPASLAANIQKAGILSPLLVRKTDKELHILDGHRRLQVARQLDISQVPIAFLPPKSPQALLATWIHAQQAYRQLNPFEVAALVSKGPNAFNLSLEEILHTIQVESLIHLSPRNLRELPNILSLPDALKREAVSRAFSGVFLLKLATTYPQSLLQCVSRIFKTLSLSENQLDHLLEWIDEIARRDHQSPEEILAQDPLPFILNHPKMPTAKKRDTFLKAVFAMRFPKRTALDRSFQKIAQKIASLGNLRLVPPPEFAGDRFELRITFASLKDLDHALEGLTKLRAELKTLFKLI